MLLFVCQIMEPDEKVLSDVHLASENINVNGKEYTVSRLDFTLPHQRSDDAEDLDEESDGETDEDGDLRLKRKTRKDPGRKDWNSLTLAHWMATELKDVGKQVWLGSLLLADFLIHIQDQLRDNTVVELGAGTGLASIVASFFAKEVICTDTGDEVLKLAEHNLDQNWNCLDPTKEKNFKVCQLDWMTDGIETANENYILNPENFRVINTAKIFIAGDVVYDDKLTTAFLNTVHDLMVNSPPRSLYLSMEKRYIFTLEDKDVVAPAYEFFCEGLRALTETTPDTGAEFHYQEIPLNFPQCFSYNRTKELILYRIYTTFPGS